LKKDKAGNATAKVARLETITVSPAPRVKPELALPVMYFRIPYPFFVLGFD
jgi:transcription initiation factor TFIID subunit 5